MPPKSVFENEILENIKATQLELDEEDVRRLRGLNRDDKNSRLLKVKQKLLGQGNVCICIGIKKLMSACVPLFCVYMQGNVYWREGVYEEFWDVVEDEKYVI